MVNEIELPLFLDDICLRENLPPLVLTAFTRPDLLKKVLDGICQQTLKPLKIIAFVDGARNNDDQDLINRCITLLDDFSSSIPIKIVKRKQNLGCDQNVIQGFFEVFTSHESLIYLEDDDIPNPCFYDRMCRLLEAYRNHKQVCSVSSYATLPSNLYQLEEQDFVVSNRFFSWGFGTWSDRWQEINLNKHSAQYNPFGSFEKIPATIQTKMTMVNQFWLEKNKKTDWVITFTLCALYHGKVHITPTKSFVYNVGFGHPQSETYNKGKEPPWVNAAYKTDFYPNQLPTSLEVPEKLNIRLSDLELIQHLYRYKSLWLKPSAMFFLMQESKSFTSKFLILKLFIERLPVLLKRWRSGLIV